MDNEHPNIDKMNQHLNEWNSIAMFFEWLNEKHLFLARHETDKEALEAGRVYKGKPNPFPYPIALGRNAEDLMYEYFDVDPNKLELERRKILEDYIKRAEEKT